MADDTEEPYLWSDSEVEVFLNEAEAEAATRSKLLVETTDPDLCYITTEPGTAFYTLSPKIIEIRRVKSSTQVLTRTSFAQLDSLSDSWESESGDITSFVQTLRGIQFYKTPNSIQSINLTVVRLPVPMTVDGPEIPSNFHVFLLDWALYLAYTKRDVDVVVGAETYAKRFEQTFGPAQTANMKRQQLESVPIQKQQIDRESINRPTWF